MGKILVTGATGFTGSNICRRLIETGEDVVAFVRPGPQVASLQAMGVECRIVDIKDADSVNQHFDGIDRVIARRVNTNSIGFNVNKEQQEYMKKNLLQYVNAQDLKSFGLIPELLGRLPVVTYLNPLNTETLRSILTVPKNALIKQYQKLFELDKVTLHFTQDALTTVAKKAIEQKTGARGLRNVLESAMLDIMYSLPSQKNLKECVINASVIEKSKPPLLIFDTDVQDAAGA